MLIGRLSPKERALDAKLWRSREIVPRGSVGPGLEASVGIVPLRGMGANRPWEVCPMTVAGPPNRGSRKVAGSGRVRQESAEGAWSWAWSLKHDRCLNAYGNRRITKHCFETVS